MRPRTQSDIEALLGFTMKGWIPLDTLTYKGEFNGWPVEYSRTYTGVVDANGQANLVTLDELQGATAFLEANGVRPLGVPSNVPDGRTQSAPQSDYANAAPAQPQQQQFHPAAGWACPIHQYQKIKPGYGGRGFECGVTTNFQPPYKARPWNGRNGPAWTCDEKSG